MSYDINIWSRNRIEIDREEITIGEYVLTVDQSVAVENEDIPIDVMLSLSEIKYLTSFYLQPFTNEKTVIDKVTRYVKKLAKEFDGVVEDKQLENGVLFVHKRKTFTRAIRDAEIVSICWYMDCQQSLSNQMAEFIELLEMYLPQALPRRYGSHEPPQFQYSETGKEHLISFLKDEHRPVIYCTKPITHLVLSDAYIENQSFARKDYRCNRIKIELLKEAYSEPNWQYAIKKLFQEAAKLFKPFYAEIIDEAQSQVCSWWWKGIPEKRGNPIIIGEPYSTFSRKLSKGNELEPGLYYFERDVHKIKIPRKFISKKKAVAKNKRETVLFADHYNYARHFPFKK